MSTLKYSRQRESILNFLENRKDHPTADTVYANLRKEFPNISLGTVYRNLSLLADIGQIQKIVTGEGPDRFDYTVNPHYHFICTECGNVLDIDVAIPENFLADAGSNFSGSITGHRTYFYGLCEDCSHKNELQ